MSASIPFLDLTTQHAELEGELTAVFQKALHTAAFIGGPVVEQFEQEFASFCETKHCVGVGSGTDALRFALIAAGVRPGDSVITVPNTFIATTEAITQAGATPEFVDIDERTYNMDPAKLRDYIENRCARDSATGNPVSCRTGRRVTAVVPVHLYGQMADMDPILELAESYNLLVIEDACQAHGAEYFSRKLKRWCKAGSMGQAAAFSFYPGKNLGACGEAGAVTTNDEGIVTTVRMIRDHGQAKKYYHDMEGYNGRLDAIQAGILSVKLKQLEKWNQLRTQAAARYAELFADHQGIVLPYQPATMRPVFHLYVVQIDDREELREHLADAGIGTGIHYPIPLHLQKAYAYRGYKKGEFPAAEAIADKILSLPMFPTITRAQQLQVVLHVAEFANWPTVSMV